MVPGLICEICKQSAAEVDGKTCFGPWAYMCLSCHEKYGMGLGLGKGQYLDKEKERKRKEKEKKNG